MRKINEIEVVTFLYTFYFSSTLFLAPNLFNRETSELYRALMQIVETQQSWVYISLGVSIIYIISFSFDYYLISALANAIGGLFLASIGITYLFTYPNIGSGIFLLLALACFFKVYKLSNNHEEKKFQKYKVD